MSELGALFEDVAERIFGDLVSQERLEAAERGEWPAGLWKAVEEAGLTRALLPEHKGGAGAAWSDVYPVIAAAGRHAAPIPLAESMLATWLLDRAGLEAPAGVLSVVPHGLEEGTLTEAGLTATLRGVPWGDVAEHLVFVAPGGDHARVGLIRTRPASVVARENLAREPRVEIRLREAGLVAAADADLPGEVMQLHGALLRSAQMTGALEALLEMSVGYANERAQFGKPIGKFQAIQQELARLAGEVAAAGMASRAAFQAADRAAAEVGFDPWVEIAVAKVRLGDAADLAPGIAHQVHGAIGFTYEHRLHFFTRRLWSWRAEFGTAAQWAERLGAEALRQGPRGLWPWVTGR